MCVLWRAPLAAAATDATIELRFIPQESTGISSPSAVAESLQQPLRLVFEDVRALKDPLLVGDATDDDDEPFAWRATTSVDDFARGVFSQLAAGWGIQLSADSSTMLRVKLARFWVAERNQAVGSTYAAEVRVTATLEDAAGRQIGRFSGSGEAHRYGKKRSAANCSEVLSDAMKAAYAGLLTWPQNPAHPASTDGPTAPPGQPIEPAILKEELLKLKAGGFTDEVLIQHINGKSLTDPLTADDLLAWKKEGLSEDVIRAAMGRPVGGGPGAP